MICDDWMRGSFFIVQTSNFLLLDATAVTLGQGHEKVIQYTYPDICILCPKYLRLSLNCFDVRGKCCCGSGRSGRGGGGGGNILKTYLIIPQRMLVNNGQCFFVRKSLWIFTLITRTVRLSWIIQARLKSDRQVTLFHRNIGRRWYMITRHWGCPFMLNDYGFHLTFNNPHALKYNMHYIAYAIDIFPN